MAEPIKLENLRDLISMGAVKTATILGQKGGFAVLASTGLQERILANKVGQVKMFATTDTAVKELARLGLSSFLVDISHYEKGLLRAPRTDVTERAKRAAAALEHEQWFRAQVDEAIQQEESGVATLHAHDDVWAEVKKATAATLARRNTGPAARAPRNTAAPSRGRKKGL
ncbi:hypothetical protein [Luteibacter sp. dw_328]|uniref:hypothetical protein n=1 Tax=Luteibacter sp. dw_328 TaxID=2719796 RepID=UPI001BD605E3|nr:hypothetical protein [Luteibacter sp. dw_328]